MHKRTLISEFLKKRLKTFFEFLRIPVEALGIGDNNTLERINGFLSELSILAEDSILNVECHDLIDTLKGFQIGENAIVGGFSDLRLGISKIADYFCQNFSSDVVLDIFGVEIDDLQDEHGGMKIDLFLDDEKITLCSWN